MKDEEFTQVIDTFNSYLERMSSSVGHFCEDLDDSDFQEISMVLPAITEGLEWINDMLANMAPLGKIPEQKWIAFQTLLKSITEALENKDNILLNDLFQFELLPLLDDLKITG